MTAPFSPKDILLEFDGVTGEEIVDYDVPLMLAGKTDIWVSAEVSIGSTKVSGDIEIILVDD